MSKHDDQAKPLPLALRTRAILATAMLLVCASLLSVSIASGFWMLQLLKQAGSNGITRAQAEAFDDWNAIIGIAFLVAFVVSAITFICWFYRAYWNLKARGIIVDHPTLGAISYWFIPFLNLFRPYQIMKELAESSAFPSISATPLPAFWWGTLILGSAIGQISAYIAMNPKLNIRDLEILTLVDILGKFCAIIAAALCTVLVWRVTKAQDRTRQSLMRR
jgi:hypothetical protein